MPFEIREISIPMEDGGRLAGDLYLPGDGTYPTIVTITQASREKWRSSHFPLASFSRSGDYAVVFVNTRGLRASRNNPRRGGTNPFGQGPSTLGYRAPLSSRRSRNAV